MNAKRWTALGIASFLFLFSAISSFVSGLKSEEESLFGTFFGNNFWEEEILEEGNPSKKIVVMELNGVIEDTGDEVSLFTTGYNHRLFMQQLKEVKENPTVKGLVLRVNSPGGTVVESAEIHDQIVEIMEEKEIPVYVSMGGTAASGGYYISAPATKIFASADTITGSIGVIMQNYNVTELAEKLGIETITIKSGPYKDIMSMTREMTEEEKTILQNMLNNAYESFVDVIEKGRGMTEQEVKAIADGRIFDGRQAKELNLIDELGYLDDVIEAMKQEQDLENAQVVKITKGSDNLFSWLGVLTKNITIKNDETSFMLKLFEKKAGPKLMYLYSN
mgnify:CR=1 FL=1